MSNLVFQNSGVIFCLSVLGLVIAFVPLIIKIAGDENVITGLYKKIVIGAIGLISVGSFYFSVGERSKGHVDIEGGVYQIEVSGISGGQLLLMKKEYRSPEALAISEAGLETPSFDIVMAVRVKCGSFTYDECVSKIKNGLGQLVSSKEGSSSKVVQF